MRRQKTVLETLLILAEQERQKGNRFSVMATASGYEFNTYDSEGIPLRRLPDNKPDWSYPNVWCVGVSFYEVLRDGLGDLAVSIANTNANTKKLDADDNTKGVKMKNNKGEEVAPEHGWLIERDIENKTVYVSVENELFTWTTDSTLAIRLSRKEDAERLAKVIDYELSGYDRVAEHQWG